MCVLIRPPVRTVCPNHEVVVFQPRTVTATSLGSGAMLNNFILAPTAPPVSTVSGSVLIPFSILPPPHQYPFFVVASLCRTRSPPPLPARNAFHLDISHTRHPPASAASLCAPRRVPASVAVSRVRSPPLCCLRRAPRSLLAPGGSVFHVS